MKKHTNLDNEIQGYYWNDAEYRISDALILAVIIITVIIALNRFGVIDYVRNLI